MAIAHFMRRWRRLPGRAALLVGLGALSATGARADTPAPPPGTGAGDLQLHSEGGRIWLAEGSGELHELALGDTAEARRLKELIEARESAGNLAPLRLRPTILAGGGGMGFSWWSHPKPEGPVKADASGKPDKAQKADPPTKKDPAGAAKKD